MNIQQASAQSGLSKPNIRYYEKEGLLQPGRNPGNGYREYEAEHVERLKQIKCLRALGIPVPELRQVLEGEESLKDALERRREQLQREQQELERICSVCNSLAAQETELEQLDADLLFLKLEFAWKKKEVQMNREREKRLEMWERRGDLLVKCGIAANCAWQLTRIIPGFAPVRNNPFVMVPMVSVCVVGIVMLCVARNLRR